METETNTEKIYDKKMIVLEAQHDATTTTRSVTSSFSIDLNSGGFGELRDVIGLHLHSLEIVPRDGTSLVSMANSSVYVTLNDYTNIVTGISTLPPVFARVTVTSTGGTSFQSSDNEVYMLDPVVGKLSKFKVTLLTKSGAEYDTKNNNVIITLVVYTKRNKYSRS
jgi:hypothetical protein